MFNAGNRRVRSISNGIVSTFAGTGDTYLFSDGMQATATGIRYPLGLAVSRSAHNVYVTDAVGDVLQEVDYNSGIVHVVAGRADFGNSGNNRRLFVSDGSMASGATLLLPSDVFINTNGLIYLSDSGNYEVRALTAGVPTYSPTSAPTSFLYGIEVIMVSCNLSTTV